MAPTRSFRFDPPARLLLGPGPSQVPARVLAALARPTVGYLDPSYVALMRAVQQSLRGVFETKNDATLTVTGSGTAAMEAAVFNMLEPGDRAIVCVHGYFGDRMRQIMERAGAEVHVVESPWGSPIDPSAVERKLAQLGQVRLVGIVHGETSTGVMQPLVDLAAITHRHGALILVDAVASLAGASLHTDAWDLDVVYSGAQKCLSVPPGCSPLTFSNAAMEAVRGRQTPCRSWYFDLGLNLTYWDQPPRYHHTGPINLMYALYEGLRMVEEEGLPERIARTAQVANALWAGLEALNLTLLVAPKHRLPTLTTVNVPDGVDEASVRRELLERHHIEIAGGLGPLAGRTWRVGLMGESCQARHVLQFLAAFATALRTAGHRCSTDDGLAAAAASLRF